jgi:predicted transposase/invertase (TIGR01784 family)
MGELDWNTGINDAKKEGFTKGLIKGRNEGLTKGRNKGLIEGRNEANLENAQKMKAMGFLMEQIQAVTGLSTDTIARL